MRIENLQFKIYNFQSIFNVSILKIGKFRHCLEITCPPLPKASGVGRRGNCKLEIVLAIVFSLTTYFLLPTTISASTISRPMSNSGLVGYWNFEEGTGNSRTFDRSGNGNTGTLTSMDPLTDWVNGATSTGQALDFDGNNDYVSVGDSVNLDIVGSITVATWVRANSFGVGGDEERLVFKGTGPSNGNIYTLGIGDSKAMFSLHLAIFSGSNCQGSSPCIAGNTTLATNRWYYLVGTYDGTVIRIYVDGRLDGSQNAVSTGTADANAVLFGARSDGQDTLTGSLDEVRIYNRALTSSEVERLYKLQKPKVASGVDNTGLVGYWAFEEGIGTRAVDSSFNNNIGTLTTMDNSDWVTGRVGGALDFDGGNEYVQMAGYYPVTGGNPRTISAWIKPRDTGAAKVIAMWGSTAVSGGRFQFVVTVGDKLSIGIEGSSFGGVVDVEDGFWHHVVAKCTGNNLNTCSLFVDGSLDTNSGTSATIDTTSTNDPLTIGYWPSGTFGPFDGQIDEVRIYNRALTSSEVERLYKGSKASVVNKTKTNRITNGLVGYWTFDGKDIYSTTALDRSGSGNNGTLTNGPVPTLGKIGQALSFDGSNDYVDVGTMSGIDVSTVTYSAWVYPINTTGGGIMYTGNGTTIHTKMDKLGNPPRVEFTYVWSTSICKSATTNGTLPVNAWTHVVVTYDRSIACSASYGPSIYLNGVLKSSADTRTGSGGALTGTNRVTIGSSLVPSFYFPGRIDDVRIYNRILTADEVYQLYNMGR